jgi:hypothetical protein
MYAGAACVFAPLVRTSYCRRHGACERRTAAWRAHRGLVRWCGPCVQMWAGCASFPGLSYSMRQQEARVEQGVQVGGGHGRGGARGWSGD